MQPKSMLESLDSMVLCRLLGAGRSISLVVHSTAARRERLGKVDLHREWHSMTTNTDNGHSQV